MPGQNSCSWHTCAMLLLVMAVSMLQSACAFAAEAGECNSTDSTESCCLKKHPGEYERCGAVSPAHEAIPRRPPPPPPAPRLPDDEETEEWERLCRGFYASCRQSVGGDAWGRKHGESHCQACYEDCRRYGSWPKKANGKPCPGGPS